MMEVFCVFLKKASKTKTEARAKVEKQREELKRISSSIIAIFS